MKVKQRLLDKMIMAMIYISLLAIVFSLIFPWFIRSLEDGDFYYMGFVLDDLKGQDFDYLINYIRYAEYAFMGAFITAVFLRIGTAFKIKSKRLSNYMTFSIIPLLVFSVIAMIYSIWTVVKLHGLDHRTYDMGFNYGPMIMSFPLVAIAVIFAIIMLPRTIRSMRELKETEEIPSGFEPQQAYPYPPPPDVPQGHGGFYMPPPPPETPNEEQLYTPPPPEVPTEEQQYTPPPPPGMTPVEQPYYQQPYTPPPPPETTPVELPEKEPVTMVCPNCGSGESVDSLSCSVCGNSLSKKCPECDMIINISMKECPNCKKEL